jgi:hypothetical protein
MTKQFAKKSLAAVLTTAALTFAAVTPARAAGQSEDWFEEQRPLTDGVGFEIQRDAAPPRAAKGPEGRVGEPAVSSQGKLARTNNGN